MELDLHLLWFILLGLLLTGYAVLDGFDLGVGILHLAARGDYERRLLLNSIGPLWDGNEVWLVTFGGALFAVFPNAYAAVFSGYYLPFMVLLFALILRAVSIEFRSKMKTTRWRQFWDVGFFLASLMATLLYGVAVGNAMLGMPIGPDQKFTHLPSLWELFQPFPILVGLMTVALFAMHGAIYLYLKTEDYLQQRVKRWLWRSYFAFCLTFVSTTAYAVVYLPHATANLMNYPWTWLVPILNVLAILNISRAFILKRPLYAFISSCCTVAALVFLFGLALFPNLVTSSIDPKWSLTIYNAASSAKTLTIAAWFALCGMPFVLTYTGVVYWTFRGKVQMGQFSY